MKESVGAGKGLSKTLEQPAKPLVATDVVFRHDARAKRYIARVDEGANIRLTVPVGGSEVEALEFLNAHRDWIEKERKAALSALVRYQRLTCGNEIWFRGERVRLQIEKDWGRPVLRFADQRFFIADENMDLARPLAIHIRGLAASRFPERLRSFAARFGLSVSRVSVRDQKTRWGSCSSGGTISLNWRLMLAPDETADYVMIHELAHMRHFNHSTAFWQLVSEWCPGYEAHEQWLSEHQDEMRW